MTSEFEILYSKATLFQAALDVLKYIGKKPTEVEVLSLIKTFDDTDILFDPLHAAIQRQAALIRSRGVRRALNKDSKYSLRHRDFQKGIRLIEEELRRKGLTFKKF